MMLKAGPASSTRIRCQGGLRVNDWEQLGGGDRPFALIEQLHVAAERQHGDGVDRAVLAGALDERLAEADRESQHLEAEAPGDPEMAELVDRDQQAHGHDEPQGVPGEIHA